MDRLRDKAAQAGATREENAALMKDKEASLRMMREKDALIKRETDEHHIAVKVSHKVWSKGSILAVFR